MSRKAKIMLVRVGLVAGLIILWELLTGGLGFGKRILNPTLAGHPSAILPDFVDYATSGLLLSDTRTTVVEAFLGLVLGLVSGVLVGLAFAYWRTVADVFDPLIVAVNSLPRPALAPIMILWFGLGMTSKIVLSWSLVFFVIFFNTLAGAKAVHKTHVRALTVMGATRGQIVRHVVLPSVFSWVFAGLRASVSFALIGAVIGEFVGASRGLGYRMLVTTGTLETNLTYGILIWLMFIGVFLVAVAQKVERALLKWRTDVTY